MDHNAVSGVNPPVMARKLVRLLTDSKDVKMSYVCNGSVDHECRETSLLTCVWPSF